MKAIEIKINVRSGGQASLTVPSNISPGEHSALLVIDDQPNSGQSQKLSLPLITVGTWPSDFSLRREDLYGNDGR